MGVGSASSDAFTPSARLSLSKAVGIDVLELKNRS
jgi:hypothetical protein